MSHRPGRRWSYGTLGALLVAAALAGWGMQVRHQLPGPTTRLAAVRTDIHDTSAQLVRLEGSLRHTRAASASAHRALAQADGQLADAKSQLADAQAGEALEQVSTVTLQSCLEDLQAALNELAVGDRQGASRSLAAVAPSCRSAGSESS